MMTEKLNIEKNMISQYSQTELSMFFEFFSAIRLTK